MNDNKKSKSVVAVKNTSGATENPLVNVLHMKRYCDSIELEKYNRVSRKAVQELARTEQKMRSDALTATHCENMRMYGIMSHSQLYAFLIFVGLIGAGCYAIYCGMEKVAVWAFGMVGVFAQGTKFAPLLQRIRRSVVGTTQTT